MKFTMNEKVALLSFDKNPDIPLQQAKKKRDNARKLITAGIDPPAVKKEHIKSEKAKTEYAIKRIARDWHASRLPSSNRLRQTTQQTGWN